MEIMLVLAIATVIIVMSVRYYQSASSTQQANACLSYLQAVAAADSLSEATQSYSGITDLEINALVPRNEAVCNRLGNDTVINQKAESIGFLIQIPIPACRLIIPALKSSRHWTWGDTHIQ